MIKSTRIRKDLLKLVKIWVERTDDLLDIQILSDSIYNYISEHYESK
jgi:hypothetical protein